MPICGSTFDTLEKLGICAGLGFSLRGVEVNLRIRTSTRCRGPCQMASCASSTEQPGSRCRLAHVGAAINNGTYSGSTHIASIGLTLRLTSGAVV